MQNYVEFSGGGHGIKIKANGVRGRPLQKKGTLQKKTLFVRFVREPYVLGFGIWPAYHIVSYFFNVDFLWQDSGSRHMLMPAFGSVLHFFECGLSWP